MDAKEVTDWHTNAQLRLPGLFLHLKLYQRQTPSAGEDVILERQTMPTISMITLPGAWRGRGRFISSDVCTSYSAIGRVVLRPPGIAMQAVGAGTLSPLLTCAFDQQMFEDVTGLSFWSRDILDHCLDIRIPRISFALRNMALELSQPGFGHEMAIEACSKMVMLDLARNLRRDCSAPSVKGGLAGWQVRRVEEILFQTEYHWPSLGELAADCGISEGHLSRGFRAAKGITLKEFAQQIRLERALQLLSSGMQVKQVASVLGFSTTSAFSVAFKREMGQTIREYRARPA